MCLPSAPQDVLHPLCPFARPLRTLLMSRPLPPSPPSPAPAACAVRRRSVSSFFCFSRSSCFSRLHTAAKRQAVGPQVRCNGYFLLAGAVSSAAAAGGHFILVKGLQSLHNGGAHHQPCVNVAFTPALLHNVQFVAHQQSILGEVQHMYC